MSKVLRQFLTVMVLHDANGELSIRFYDKQIRGEQPEERVLVNLQQQLNKNDRFFDVII